MSKYKQGQVLSIVYDVWISGTKLGLAKKQCIDSIEIRETVEGSDVATLTIYDPEFLYIEDNIFLEDNKIKIKLGWDNTTYRVTFNGYISAIDINFASTGIPLVMVTCMDNTHKMNRKKKNKTFNKKTSAQVVKSIVKKHGFKCVVDKTYKFTKQETITQSNQTDIDFITKLAGQEVYPFTARLVGNTFYYVKMGKLTTPKMTLTYRTYPHEIISFSPQINKESKQVEITSSSVDTGSKSVSTTKASTGNTKNGSSSSNGTKNTTTTYDSSTSDTSSGGNKKSYTYDPKTKTWK